MVVVNGTEVRMWNTDGQGESMDVRAQDITTRQWISNETIGKQ
jgi:hypothetical protein